MSKQYVNFANGWVKNTKAGDEYVSATTEGKFMKTKLHLELEDGTMLPVKSFAMFFNKNKKKENHPDVQFTLTLEE